jgi:hypothetical protein
MRTARRASSWTWKQTTQMPKLMNRPKRTLWTLPTKQITTLLTRLVTARGGRPGGILTGCAAAADGVAGEVHPFHQLGHHMEDEDARPRLNKRHRPNVPPTPVSSQPMSQVPASARPATPPPAQDAEERLDFNVPPHIRRAIEWMQSHPEHVLGDLDSDGVHRSASELMESLKPIPDTIDQLNREHLQWVVLTWQQKLIGRSDPLPFTPGLVNGVPVELRRRCVGLQGPVVLVFQLYGKNCNFSTVQAMHAHYERWLLLLFTRFRTLKGQQANGEADSEYNNLMERSFTSVNVQLAIIYNAAMTMLESVFVSLLGEAEETESLAHRGGLLSRTSYVVDGRFESIMLPRQVQEMMAACRVIAAQELAIMGGVDLEDPVIHEPILYGERRLRTGVFRPRQLPHANGDTSKVRAVRLGRALSPCGACRWSILADSSAAPWPASAAACCAK